jgi:hypothetical protein
VAVRGLAGDGYTSIFWFPQPPQGSPKPGRDQGRGEEICAALARVHRPFDDTAGTWWALANSALHVLFAGSLAACRCP